MREAGTVDLPPQAPSAGRFKRLLGPFYFTGEFWYRFPVWGVRVLPKWAVGIFVAIFTPLFFLALGQIRQAIGSNLAVVLGPCGFWRRQLRVWRTFWNFAWCLTERYEGLVVQRRVQCDADSVEEWRGLLDESDGFVLVTAHVGHWEMGSMIAGSRRRRPVNVVREEELDPASQDFFQKLYQGLGEDLLKVHFARDDPSFGIRLLQALRRGEIVALQGDRPRATSRSFPAELFGRPTELPPGPVTLARTSGAVILPIFAFRTGRLRTRVIFRPPIRVERSDDRQADVAAGLARIAAEVEWAVRQAPFQWFCFRQLWPEAQLRPPSEAPPRPRFEDGA